MTENKGSYASVNGLEMYYEIHGTGQPLVVLHGAYMTIETMGEIVPGLAETRQVIAVEACLDDAMDEELAQAPVTHEDGRNDRWDQVPAETRYL